MNDTAFIVGAGPDGGGHPFGQFGPDSFGSFHNPPSNDGYLRPMKGTVNALMVDGHVVAGVNPEDTARYGAPNGYQLQPGEEPPVGWTPSPY